MISLTTFLISVSAATVIYLFFKKRDKKLNLPPGPFCWPIIGNTFEIGNNGFHLKMSDWARKYGDVFCCTFGSNRTMVISDPKMVREAMNDINLSGRPHSEAFTLVSDGPRGIINSVGKEWEEQRRFTLRHLRDFGFGKNYLESTIMDEVNDLLESFKKVEGQPVDVSRKFSLAVLNSLWQILCSKRYKQDDPKLLNILLNSTKLNEVLTTNPWLLLPKLAKMAPSLTGWNYILSLIVEVKQFIKDSVKDHQTTYSDSGEHRDFLDAYIHEMKATTDPNSSFYKDLGEINVTAVVNDLFAAGSETTATTLNFLMLVLSKFSHVQKKVQEELDSVVGKNRQPSLSDRPNLPYCLAVMDELLRFNSLTPLGLFHTALADTKLQGYDIPKGTWIAANFYWIHYNPQLFHNPKEFNPSRFLSADGKTFHKNENVMAFSTGKRACLGETLARDEYFLFFTSIFQRFEIELAEEFKNMDITPKPAFLLAAPPFKVVMKDRLTN